VIANEVRTRFAPSPTGFMHLGNLRTALYAYLLAKKDNGTFILRIEDTDQERFVEGAIDIIYRTMKDTGLVHDEGPDKDGGYGPYIQSERRDIYKEYAEKLVELGGAYYCFCDKERLDELRLVQEASKLPTKYDGYCTKLSKQEVRAKIDAGVPYVIRQKMPKDGTTSFDDCVFGKITVENSTLDDNVLLKTDGLPTYNFANVIDDHLMHITHVIRGSEYLSSTPKYNLLYEAFGWEKPVYIHCSPVMRDAQHKLSKRDGDAYYEDFIAKGYLKEAVLNYIALLGWAPSGEQEIFSLSELTQVFDIKGISKSPAIFDINKLNWMNGEYIRKMSVQEFLTHAKPYLDTLKRDVDQALLARLLHDRTEKFEDIPDMIDFLDEMCEYDCSMYKNKKMKTDEALSLDILKKVLPLLEQTDDFSEENMHAIMFGLVADLGVKNGIVLFPIRVALSGKSFTPGGSVEIAALLGKEETINRIKGAIAKLEAALS